jgi:hypothetical protein
MKLSKTDKTIEKEISRNNNSFIFFYFAINSNIDLYVIVGSCIKINKTVAKQLIAHLLYRICFENISKSQSRIVV